MNVRAAALVLTVALAACAAGPRSLGSEGAEQIQITVDNRNFNDATIYTVTVLGQERLGIVTGKTERTFQLPWRRHETLGLRVRMVARNFQTESLPTVPGDRLQLIIQSVLSRSYFGR